MKDFAKFFCLICCIAIVTGCGRPTAVEVTPDDVSKYDTPEGYEPSAEEMGDPEDGGEIVE